MFILIRTDDSSYTETTLVSTYNTWQEAHDYMTLLYEDAVRVGGHPEDYRNIDDFSASVWTEMDGGAYWHIFNTETDCTD